MGNEPICNELSLSLSATRRGRNRPRGGVKFGAPRSGASGTGRMSWVVDGVGRFLAHYLEKPAQGYEPFTPSDPEALRETLRPGDGMLVEGNNHISGVIKYLTQSTWSHAALHHGPIGDRVTADGGPLAVVEANIGPAGLGG